MNNSNQCRRRHRKTIGFAIRVAALAWVSLVASPPARADIILQDAFNGAAGSHPDTNLWATTTTVQSFYHLSSFGQRGTLDGAGQMDIGGAAGNPDVLAANPSFLTPPTLPLRLTVVVTSVSSAHQTSLGLTDFGSNDIQVRDDSTALTGLPAAGGGALGGPLGGPGDWIVLMQTAAGYQEALVGVSAAAGNAGTWLFSWKTNEVRISFDNTVVFDTALDAPALGGSGWNIPTAPLIPDAFTYSSGGLTLDQVVFENVPEPSSLLFLVTGGLVMIRHRWIR